MEKQMVCIGVVVLLLSVGLCGCDQLNNTLDADRDNFVGTWQNATEYPAVIMFSTDGTCTYGGADGTWELKENKLSITLSDSAEVHNYNYWFSNSNRTLLLTKTFGYSLVYTKQ